MSQERLGKRRLQQESKLVPESSFKKCKASVIVVAAAKELPKKEEEEMLRSRTFRLTIVSSLDLQAEIDGQKFEREFTCVPFPVSVTWKYMKKESENSVIFETQSIYPEEAQQALMNEMIKSIRSKYHNNLNVEFEITEIKPE